jgi:hypothetical protein
MRGIGVPRKISFFEKLVSDDCRARYMQDLQSNEGRSKFYLHAEFYRLQQYNHMVDSIVASTGLSRDEAAKELSRRGHDVAVDRIVALTGLLRDEATKELGRRSHDGAVVSIVASTGLLRDEAATELGRRANESKEKKYTREEITVMQKLAGKMVLGKGRGPRRQNGKLPDWMVVVEVNPHTKIELSDPGPRCAQTKNNIAAQICD